MYMKMSDKSTTKAMFTYLCSNYEGNKKVREAKTIMLVHQYELFKLKDDESILVVLMVSDSSLWTSNTEEKLCSF